MGAVRATVIPVEIGRWNERTNEWINGRIIGGRQDEAVE